MNFHSGVEKHARVETAHGRADPAEGDCVCASRRRRQGLLRSLENPHPEAAELAEMGLVDWGASLPASDEGLVDERAGKAVRWVEGLGWVEESA